VAFSGLRSLFTYFFGIAPSVGYTSN